MSDKPTILPFNAGAMELHLEQLCHRFDGITEPVKTLWSAENIPEPLLPYLAWAFSVETWDPAWDVATRRAYLLQAARIHRQKGTIGAVRRALEAIGFEVQISEWFDTGGAAHTFEVVAGSQDIFDTGAGFDPALALQIRALIEEIKPVRSHFTIEIGETKRTHVYLRSGHHTSYTDGATHVFAQPEEDRRPPTIVRSGHLGYVRSVHTHVLEGAAA